MQRSEGCGESPDRREAAGVRGAAASADEPAPAKVPSREAVGTAFGCWMAILGIYFFILTYVVPSFEAMFKDLGGGLPASTVLFLNASQLVRSPIGLVASALVVLASIWILLLPWPRSRKILIFTLPAIAGLLLIPVCVVSLFLPLVGEVRSVR